MTTPQITKSIFAVLLLSLCVSQIGAASNDPLLVACNGCHGTDGISQGQHVPTISGLNFQYFYSVMRAYQDDRRSSVLMGRLAKAMPKSKLQKLALHYGSQPWTGNPAMSFDAELAQQGQALHQANCIECHKNNGHYQDQDTPPLAGQAKGYLLVQMQDFRNGIASTHPPAVMQQQLESLNDQQLAALAEFYSSSLALKQP